MDGVFLFAHRRATAGPNSWLLSSAEPGASVAERDGRVVQMIIRNADEDTLLMCTLWIQEIRHHRARMFHCCIVDVFRPRSA